MAAADDDQSGGAKRPPRRRKPTHGNPNADPVLVHRRFVEQRLWSGDAAPEGTEPEPEPEPDGGPTRSMRAADDSGAGGAGGDDVPEEVRERDLEELARERYDQAIDQWHRLPGSVSRPPTEVTGPTGAGTDESTDDAGDDADDGSSS